MIIDRSIMYRKTSTSLNVVIPLMALAFFSYSCIAECPSGEFIEQSKLDQIRGVWWVVAAAPPKLPPSRCSRCNFTLTSGNLHLEFTALSSDSKSPVIFNANIATFNMSGTWNILNSTKKIGYFKHTVLALEESCAVMIICKLNGNNVSTSGHAMILSREKSLDKQKLDAMKKILGDHIDKDKIVNVEQHACHV